MALEKIQKANDIKELTEEELKELSDEIRQFLIEKISVTGGHLASNLGVVELTMALHKVLHFPEDKLLGCGTSVLYTQASDRKKRRI